MILICNAGRGSTAFWRAVNEKGLLISHVAGLLLFPDRVQHAGRFSPEVTGVSVSKNGAVTEVVMESFDASYYSEEELKSTVESEIADYNSSHGDKAVKKKSLEVKDGEAQMRLVYDSYQNYAGFNMWTSM